MLSEGRKDDKDKPRLELIPPQAMLEVGKVMAYGAKKYAPWNWTKIEDEYRYVGAAMRHLYQRLLKTHDAESRLRHLAHAAASALIALELEILREQKTEKLVQLKVPPKDKLH